MGKIRVLLIANSATIFCNFGLAYQSSTHEQSGLGYCVTAYDEVPASYCEWPC